MINTIKGVLNKRADGGMGNVVVGVLLIGLEIAIISLVAPFVSVPAEARSRVINTQTTGITNAINDVTTGP